MSYLGAILFILIFVLIGPKSRIFLAGLATGASGWIAHWAPYSYILLLILPAALFAGLYLVHTAPPRVDEENPMARYRREVPFDED